MKPGFLIAVVSVLFVLGCDNESQTASTRPMKYDSNLVAELAAMVDEDQQSLQQAVQTEGEANRKIAFAKKDEILKKNTERVEQIFNKYGFPGFDLVGPRGSRDFWLIVQHSDAMPEFQQRVLSEMRLQVEQANADELDFAFLWDRVKKNSGEPQRYGSQVWYTDEGQAVPFRIENSKSVNKTRSKIGLEPIEEYLNGMSEMHYEINKAHFSEKGIEKPMVYEKDYSSRFLFAAPKKGS